MEVGTLSFEPETVRALVPFFHVPRLSRFLPISAHVAHLFLDFLAHGIFALVDLNILLPTALYAYSRLKN